MKTLNTSRRDFLHTAGKGMIGAAALSVAPSLLSIAQAGETISAPDFPFEYKPLDKQEVLEFAYQRFYDRGGCCAGVVCGIMELMAEKYGYPYNQINGRMFALGAGGYGIQSLCGSIGGADAVLALFAAGDAGDLRTELYNWYKVQEFPHYTPDFPESVKTVAESVECRDSVNKFMQANNCQMGDDIRKARCAAVTGEVAAKTVELLNIHFGFEEAAPVEEEVVETASNEYIGVGKSSIGGDVKVKVTMDGDKIAKIEVLEHNETPGISDKAFETIPASIIAANSTEIDAVSGATCTSKALIDAVNDALSQIK